jgi:transposase-like protein
MHSDPAVTTSPDVAVKCPFSTCDSTRAIIEVRSASIVTFRCIACRFEWSADISTLAEPLRRNVEAFHSGGGSA